MAVPKRQRAFLTAAVALALQVAGWLVAQNMEETDYYPFGIAAFFLGAILVYVACGLLAKAKGRSAAWALLGLISVLGLTIAALLPEKGGEGA